MMPYALIIVVLLARPQGIMGAKPGSTRQGSDLRRAQPLAPRDRGRARLHRRLSAGLDDLYYQNMIMLSPFAIMGSGWNIISGFTGYVSLGQSAFLGIGAYTTAILSVRVFDGASPFWFVPASAVVAGILRPSSARPDAHARPLVRDPHDRVPVRHADRGAQLVGPDEREPRDHAALPDWNEYQNWPFYYGFFARHALPP